MSDNLSGNSCYKPRAMRKTLVGLLALPSYLFSLSSFAQSSAAFPPEPDVAADPAKPAPPYPAQDPPPTPDESLAQPSEAAPAPSEQTSPAAPSTPKVADPTWYADYARARAELLDGNFAKARRMFRELSTLTEAPYERALARELANIAESYEKRRLLLVQSADLEDSVLTARARDERTTDEISILYANAAAYGVGTGAWLAILADADSAAGVILPSLAVGGAAAGVVALTDKSKPLKYGVPASIVSGMYIGLEEGLVWTLWNQARSNHYDEWEDTTVATVIWGSATAGALAGGIIGTTSGTTPGRASYVGSTALWGGVLTGFVTAAFASDEDDQRDDAALLAGALGLNAGAIAGAITAGTVSPSIARVRFLDLGATAGGLIAGGLYVSATEGERSGSERAQGLFGTTAIGIAGGLAVAWLLTDNMAPDRGARTQSANPSLELRSSFQAVKGGSVLGVSGAF